MSMETFMDMEKMQVKQEQKTEEGRDLARAESEKKTGLLYKISCIEEKLIIRK